MGGKAPRNGQARDVEDPDLGTIVADGAVDAAQAEELRQVVGGGIPDAVKVHTRSHGRNARDASVARGVPFKDVCGERNMGHRTLAPQAPFCADEFEEILGQEVVRVMVGSLGSRIEEATIRRHMEETNNDLYRTACHHGVSLSDVLTVLRTKGVLRREIVDGLTLYSVDKSEITYKFREGILNTLCSHIGHPAPVDAIERVFATEQSPLFETAGRAGLTVVSSVGELVAEGQLRRDDQNLLVPAQWHRRTRLRSLRDRLGALKTLVFRFVRLSRRVEFELSEEIDRSQRQTWAAELETFRPISMTAEQYHDYIKEHGLIGARRLEDEARQRGEELVRVLIITMTGPALREP